jgi:hypothetical protein
MPFSLLIAIFTAFGLDLGEGSSPLGRLALRDQLLGMLAIIGSVGVYAFGLGYLVAWQSHRVRSTARLRHRFAIGARLLDLICLVGFGWIIHVLRWPDAVRRGLSLADAVLIDEVLILLPFVAMQAMGWLGLYRPSRPCDRAGRRRAGSATSRSGPDRRWAWSSRSPWSSPSARTSSPFTGPARSRTPGSSSAGWRRWGAWSSSWPRPSSAWPGPPGRSRLVPCATGWSGSRDGSASAAPTSSSGRRAACWSTRE